MSLVWKFNWRLKLSSKIYTYRMEVFRLRMIMKFRRDIIRPQVIIKKYYDTRSFLLLFYGRKNSFCESPGILSIRNIRSNYAEAISCHKTVSWYFNANFSVARVTILAEDNHRVAHSRQLLLAQRKCSQGLNLDQFNISDALFLAAALFAIAWLYVSVDWRFATAHHREFLLAHRREQWCSRAVLVRCDFRRFSSRFPR